MNMFLSGPMRKIANMGRMGDTELAHVTPEEKKLLKAMGGSGTINPRTGMPEYFISISSSGIRFDPTGGMSGGGSAGIKKAQEDAQAESANTEGAIKADESGASDRMKELLFKRYESDVLDRPYQSYTGTRYAGFNPDQEQAFTDVRSFAGTVPTAQGETTYQSGFRTAGQDQAAFQRELDARMNPFTQSVINQLQKDISEQQQMALGRTSEQARAAGAFGGSRQGVAEALTSGRYGDAFARTAGQLRADQFNRAMAGVDQDRARQEQFRGQAADTRLRAGRDLDAGTAQRINALARAGNQQQAFEQAQKDFAYQQFLEERDYDKMNILAGGGLLGSAPGDYRPPPDPVYYGRSGGLGGLFDLLFGRPQQLA